MSAARITSKTSFWLRLFAVNTASEDQCPYQLSIYIRIPDIIPGIFVTYASVSDFEGERDGVVVPVEEATASLLQIGEKIIVEI